MNQSQAQAGTNYFKRLCLHVTDMSSHWGISHKVVKEAAEALQPLIRPIRLFQGL